MSLGRLVAAPLAVLLVAGGCATAPAQQSNTVSVTWTVSPDDPCEKLAGSLALADLFDFKSPPDGPDFQESMTAELERRCPPDTQPEAFDITMYIPAGACGELRNLLEMALFFDMTVFVAPERRNMIDGLIAKLEDEVAKRCPTD